MNYQKKQSSATYEDAAMWRDVQEFVDDYGPQNFFVRLPAEITFAEAHSHTAISWKLTTLPLADFVERMMKHEVGKKFGSAWTPATFKGGRRQSAFAARAMLAVFDCDKGDTLDEIAEKLKARKIGGIISSSHSHRTRRTLFQESEWQKWKTANPGMGAADFLLGKGYRDHVAEAARLVRKGGQPKIHERDGHDYIAIHHSPCPKFRVILFVASPWLPGAFPDRGAAERAYTAGLKSLAAEIGLNIDPAATDVARLFFFPRCPADKEPESLFIDGHCVDPWTNLDTVEEDDLRSARRQRQTTGLPFEVFADAVMAIRNDERFHRTEYIKVFAAISNETDGSEKGFELADRWAATWSGGPCNSAENRRVWESLHSRDDGATGATVIYYAQRDGWKMPTRLAADNRAPHGDIWNGVRFAEQVRGLSLYVASLGQWLRWTGNRWAAMTQPDIDAVAKGVSAYLLEQRMQMFRDDPSDVNKALLALASKVHGSLDRVRKIAEAGRSEQGMSVDTPADFDRDPMLLGVANGVLDLETGRLLEAMPDHRISKVAGAAYDPKAKAPTFMRFLSDVQPDADMRSLLQIAVGYSLTGLVDEEKWFFLHGVGQNGKSVFANIISALLGEYAASLGNAIIAKGKHENEAERLKARLPGLRVALVNETATGDIWDDQRLKELASRERISARFLHREAFDFWPTHKLWVRGNHLPGALDSGHGFWRRMVPILFGQQIDATKVVPDLDRRIIAAELPGVLNWALQGVQEWQRNGLVLPGSVEDARATYRAETDLIGLWWEECCTPAPTAKVSVKEAYQSYRSFCDEQGVSAGSKMSFSRRMTDRGVRRTSDTSSRSFEGFTIRREPFPDGLV